MKILIVFASFINAGEIMMTCDQAREFCVGGIYIEPSRICTTYPDQIDPRDQTCLSDAPWLCNQLAHFRTNQHTPAKCSSPTHSVGAIGAKLKTVRHWDQDQKSGKKIVPYYFKPNDHSESDQQQIRAAFKELSDSIDCIEVVEVPADSSYTSKIRIINGSGCYSYLGRVSTRAGYQPLSLGAGCVQSGVIQHELIHALGFDHEQNRPDRDSFISINLNNVQKSARGQFDRLTTSTYEDLGSRYEIGSVMHYTAFAFAIDRNRPVIVDRETEQPVKAQRARVSSLDILEICMAYQCGCKNADGVSFCETKGTNTLRDSFYWNVRKCDGINDCENGADEAGCASGCCTDLSIGLVTFTMGPERLADHPVYYGKTGTMFFSAKYNRWVFASSTAPSRTVFGYDVKDRNDRACPDGNWYVNNKNVMAKCLTATTVAPTTLATTNVPRCGHEATCLTDKKYQVKIQSTFDCNFIFSFKIPAQNGQVKVFMNLPKTTGGIEFNFFGPIDHIIIDSDDFVVVELKPGKPFKPVKGKAFYAMATLAKNRCEKIDEIMQYFQMAEIMIQTI